MRSSSVMVLALLLAGCARNEVPLYDNLGTLHHPISSESRGAQAYFDQGLRLTYAFNHGEAIRAFREAARLDDRCAICWWGVALAYGPNINLPMDSAAGAAAWQALQEAIRRRDWASEVERDYIAALEQRYGPDPMGARAQRDSAYAAAMLRLAEGHPGDVDAAILAAEAQMDLRPWNYWQPDGTPQPGVERFIALLEGALARDSTHPGACHYYIHAVEASRAPARALSCARRLENAMPGAGHLVHMPGHLYLRLGLYADAHRVNIHAAHSDEQYIEGQRPEGVYAMAYYPHNLHFLWAAAAFAGDAAAADSAMDRLLRAAPFEMIRQAPSLEVYRLPKYFHAVWFERWDQALADSAPPLQFVASTGLWRYARGRALLAQGKNPEAAVELDSLRATHARARRDLPPGITIGFAAPATVLEIALELLAGELAAADGRMDEAVRRYQAAIRAEDALTYNEPADWYPPVRLAYGRRLLEARRAAQAEAVYRAELERRPNSRWATEGLNRSLEAQGKPRAG